MNFIETMIAISANGEKVVDERVFSITTDKFKYSRQSNGEWTQGPLPLPVDNSPYLPIEPTKKDEIK